MLASMKARLALLAMTKCGSTAIEAALAPRMDVVLGQHPRLKHMSLRKFDRVLRAHLEDVAGGRMETFALLREPVAWLASWWRYRAREELRGSPKSTQEMSFERFVREYLDGQKHVADIGRPTRFLSDRQGRIGVDHLFAYEDRVGWSGFLAARLGPVRFERVNTSPGEIPALPAALARDLETALETEFALHRQLAGALRQAV